VADPTGPAPAVSIHAVRSPERFVAHMLAATEAPAVRDMAAATQPLSADAAAYRGSIPVLRPDLDREVAEAFRVHPRRTPTRAQLEAMYGGRRADGEPLARGATAAPKNTVVVVRADAHVSWSIARNLCRTPEARALMDAAFWRANHRMMARWEQDIGGWTRRGRGGKEEQQGRVLYVSHPHTTSRATRTGWVGPMHHVENVVPNAVVTPKGHVGAIDLKRAWRRRMETERGFQSLLHEESQALGLPTELRNGVCVATDVPDSLVEAMSRRTREAIENARTYAAANAGVNPADEPAVNRIWRQLPAAAKAKLVKAGARVTQGSRKDGLADPAAWAREAAEHGYPVRDPFDPNRARRATAAEVLAEDAPRPSLLARTQALRERVVEMALRQRIPVRATIRAIAPPATDEQRAAVHARTAAVRQVAEGLAAAAADATKRRATTEFAVEIRRYRLRQFAAALGGVARAAPRAVSALRERTAAVKEAATDILAAARAGGAMLRATWRGRRIRRAAAALATGVAPRSPAGLKEEVAIAAGPPEAQIPDLPLAARRAEMGQRPAAVHLPDPQPAALARKANKVSDKVNEVFSNDPVPLPSRPAALPAPAPDLPQHAPPDALPADAPPPALPPEADAALLRAAAQADAQLNKLTREGSPTFAQAAAAFGRSPRQAFEGAVRVTALRVHRGEADLSEGADALYRRWRQLCPPARQAEADPGRVFDAIRDKLIESVDALEARPAGAPITVVDGKIGWREAVPMPPAATAPAVVRDAPPGTHLKRRQDSAEAQGLGA
jgi:TrwC relaxase